MKKVFIDAGSHKGESVEAFKYSHDYRPDFEIHCFEPNPSLKEHFAHRDDIIFHPEAIWIEDCSKDFFVSESANKTLSSTLIKSKITGKLDKENPIKVKCIDFPKWIKDNFQVTDYIIIRMNIEGAEYHVLDKMYNNGTIAMVNKLSLSTHKSKIKINVRKHYRLIEKIKLFVNLHQTQEPY